jgi:sensor c-di-GMP phosphodiesterase-like protein
VAGCGLAGTEDRRERVSRSIASIDDFGTGYSSLAYLAKLPVQGLKIDRAFVSTMLDSPDNTTLVSTMIALAHSLRLAVVAEGVETGIHLAGLPLAAKRSFLHPRGARDVCLE